MHCIEPIFLPVLSILTIPKCPVDVMFYGPKLFHADIGHDMRYHNPNQPLPMIAFQWPQGYMIMISDDGTVGTRADLPNCPNWVFAESPYE